MLWLLNVLNVASIRQWWCQWVGESIVENENFPEILVQLVWHKQRHQVYGLQWKIHQKQECHSPSQRRLFRNGSLFPEHVTCEEFFNLFWMLALSRCLTVIVCITKCRFGKTTTPTESTNCYNFGIEAFKHWHQRVSPFGIKDHLFTGMCVSAWTEIFPNQRSSLQKQWNRTNKI